MKRKFLALIILLLFAFNGVAYAQSSIELDESRTQAIANALRIFKGDGYDLKNYTIVIKSYNNEIEVMFVPPLKGGADPLQAGQPSGLPEVHYYLDSTGEKVLRRMFGQA